MSAKGSAGLTDDSPAARESALKVASLRAKRTLAEFLSSQVKSETTVRRIAKTYMRNFQSASNPETNSLQIAKLLPREMMKSARQNRSRPIG